MAFNLRYKRTTGSIAIAGILVMGLQASFGADASRKSEAVVQQSPASSTTALPAVSTNQPSINKPFDDIAQFIAGMPVDSSSNLVSLTQTPAWKKYHTVTDSAWAKFNRGKIDKIRAWAPQELSNVSANISTLFYPFSGPDFIFAHAFFPQARRYILFGLEPVGLIPNPASIAADSLGPFFKALDKAIEDAMSFSFFKTNDMKQELASQYAPGTVPILMLFIARTGNHIIDIKPFCIDTNGAIVYTDSLRTYSGDKNFNTGVEIQFVGPQGGTVQSIIYFATDISDKGLAKNSNSKNFLASIDSSSITFIKSASYLMHKSYFSNIRNTILTKSKAILQDDSGIPYKYYKKAQWAIQLYGRYDGPIDMFKMHLEEDLKTAYVKGAKTLPYRIGYDRESNLLLAVRK